MPQRFRNKIFMALQGKEAKENLWQVTKKMKYDILNSIFWLITREGYLCNN